MTTEQVPQAMNPDERNRLAIEEFRANAGRLGGPFSGIPVLLLHTIDNRTGEPRVHPLTCRPVGDGWVIFATKSGAAEHPFWYFNLLALPAVGIEYGDERIEVIARTALGDERELLWAEQCRLEPRFLSYEQQTARVIPVIVLDRA